MRLLASVLIAMSLSALPASPSLLRAESPATALALQATPPGQTGLPAATAAGQDYRFASGAGMLFFYVKPEKTTDFEAVVSRIGAVLEKSDDAVRKQQAVSWRVLKSVETQRDAAIYVFYFEPAIPGADYDPIKILGEGLPTEVQALYERLRDATIKVERMGLQKVR